MIYFVALNLIPITTEVVLSSGMSWKDDKEVHLSQDLLKGFYFTIRVGCYSVYMLRTLIIYANWKVPMESLLTPYWRLFGHEMKLIVLFFTSQLVILILSIILSGHYYTGFVSLDTFNHDNVVGYVIFNLTFIEIIENSSLLGCYYLLR